MTAREDGQRVISRAIDHLLDEKASVPLVSQKYQDLLDSISLLRKQWMKLEYGG